MYEPVQGKCMPASYVTHRMRRVKLIFRCFYQFSNMLKLMPRSAKFSYLYKGSNFTILGIGQQGLYIHHICDPWYEAFQKVFFKVLNHFRVC